MASLSADRPSEVVLAARVARQFYLEGISKVDIADRLGISRFRVARLLDSARESGLVRIEIGLPGGTLDAGLSAELCSAFGLRHAFVFNFPEDESPLRQRLGEAAGQVLMDLIAPGDVLGLTWSRTLSGLTAAPTQLPPCPIVQLTGAGPPPDGRDLLELVRGVARVGGGTAHVVYAPMLVSDAATATAIRRQGDIAEAVAPRLPSVAGVVGSIGAGSAGLSTIHDAVTPAERDALTGLGVRAELAGVFIGADGGPLATPLDSRMIVTPAALFTGIPFVLGVAYDAGKSPAVLAAIKGGLVHGLVTHTELARGLLSLANRRGLAAD